MRLTVTRGLAELGGEEARGSEVSEGGAARRVGGDPALDFVNTVGGRRPAAGRFATRVRGDKLGAYPDLVAWVEAGGLVGAGPARALMRLAAQRPGEARRVLARARRLREALSRVLRALLAAHRPGRHDLEAVGRELAAARSRERLMPSAAGLRWERGAERGRLESVLWPICRAASDLLVSRDLRRLRLCAGEDCGWLFLDASRNRSRRWCTMQDCGNVSKARRFRRRHRGEER